MRAAILKAPGILELDDIPDLECPKGGALVRVEACSVCGTDIKMLEKGHKDLAYPRILGHEIVGTVLEIAQETGIVEGDLVQVWPGIACGSCRSCLRGNDNECESIEILGFSQDGGFAELIALPKESVFRGLNPVRKHSGSEFIALAEPLACCINGQELTRVSEGDTVLIIGGGPLGCIHAVLAKIRGAEKIIIVEKLEGRREKLKRHTDCAVLDASEPLHQSVASEADGHGVDVILTATPEARVDDLLLKQLAPGGRLCIFSGPRPESSAEIIDIRSMHYRELMVVGAYGCSSRQNRTAVELLESGRAKVDWIVTKRTTLDRIHDALRYSSERRGLKSIIEG